MTFDASGNQISGSLPDSWGQNGSAFSQLQRLNVAGNRISGTLPTAWGANGGLNNLQCALHHEFMWCFTL